METESIPFYSFLTACATVKENGCDWTPPMAVAGSTLLKNRNMHMQQHHLSLSWSGNVQHRFVNEINITLVSFFTSNSRQSVATMDNRNKKNNFSDS